PTRSDELALEADAQAVHPRHRYLITLGREDIRISGGLPADVMRLLEEVLHIELRVRVIAEELEAVDGEDLRLPARRLIARDVHEAGVDSSGVDSAIQVTPLVVHQRLAAAIDTQAELQAVELTIREGVLRQERPSVTDRLRVGLADRLGDGRFGELVIHMGVAGDDLPVRQRLEHDVRLEAFAHLFTTGNDVAQRTGAAELDQLLFRRE